MSSHDGSNTPEPQQGPEPQQRQGVLSMHILPTSATMIGVCITVISIVRLFEANAAMSTIIDKVVAMDSLVFLAAALMSYLSMRSLRQQRRLENYADVAFLVGLGVLAIAGVMVAWELGNTPQ